MSFVLSAITIICCLGLVLGFRQADKNSRSIEKVKKYSDKIKEDLISFTEDKTKDLKEVAIELSSKQDAAIAAVKKLDSFYDAFMKKTQILENRMLSIENIEKRVGDSEQTIQKLMNMTALAEKNLGEISRESDFIESLAKQVNAAKDDLDMVASAIPEMKDFFSNESRVQLEQYKQKIIEEIGGSIQAVETRLDAAKKSGEELFETSAVKLNDLYKKIFEEASQKALSLEDTAFKTLKEEAAKRVREYKADFEETFSSINEEISGKIAETTKMAEDFRQEWSSETEYLSEKLKNEFSQTEQEINEKSQLLIQKMNEAESALSNTAESLKAEFENSEKALHSQLNSMLSGFQGNIDNLAKHSDKRLADFKAQTEIRFNKFEELISGADVIRTELEKNRNSIQEKVMQEFAQYAAALKQKQQSFSQAFQADTEKLSERLHNIEDSINDLNSKAYSNISEKLQNFESDFFEDLSKRSGEINISFERLKADVEERLALLASDNESARKDIEDKYNSELKTRLMQIAEDYKTKVLSLDKKVCEIENNLSQRISSVDNSILKHAEELKNEFASSLEKSCQHFENNLADYKIKLKDSVSSHHFEVENAAKELKSSIEHIKEQSLADFETVKKDFEIWRSGTEQKFDAARSLFDDKVTNIDNLISQGIENLDKKYNSQYESFSVKNADLFAELENKTKELNDKAASIKEDIEKEANAVTENLRKKIESANNAVEKRLREAESETNASLVNTREMIHNLQAELGEIQEKAAFKIQSDTNRLNNIIEEIDKKQTAFIAQTNIFKKADEMKAQLEHSIEKLQGEISRFEIYRNAMDELGLQYDKVCHMEEQAKQKIAQFMNERKRIDILETEFAKLTTLSDSMDRRLIELRTANDELQQYEVQIRKLEESITNVNTRYERIEKKEPVLDQTAKNIDDAFDELKTLESGLKDFKQTLASVPAEIENIKASMDVLLENKDKADIACIKIEEMDSMITEMDNKLEKLQNARSWLAETETRLQDISKNSEAKLRLLSDLFKSEPSVHKESGAPALSTRESVMNLYRMGWKVDQIANSLKLSRGEVDLIIEYSDKI